MDTVGLIGVLSVVNQWGTCRLLAQTTLNFNYPIPYQKVLYLGCTISQITWLYGGAVSIINVDNKNYRTYLSTIDHAQGDVSAVMFSVGI